MVVVQNRQTGRLGPSQPFSDVALDEDLLFGLDLNRNVLVALDMTAPDAPVEVAAVALPASLSKVQGSARRLLLLGSGGLFATSFVDGSFAEPAPVSFGGGTANAVAIDPDESLALVSVGSAVRVVDLDQPASPVIATFAAGSFPRLAIDNGIAVAAVAGAVTFFELSSQTSVALPSNFSVGFRSGDLRPTIIGDEVRLPVGEFGVETYRMIRSF